MATELKSDFPPDLSLARFNDALRGAMRVSKSELSDLLAKDRQTPLAPQKRGRKPKSAASGPASSDTD